MKNKWKFISIAIVCLLFLIFIFAEYSSTSSYNVLQVNSPLNIVIDTNNNEIVDENEFYKVLNDYQVITLDNVKDNKIAKNLSLDNSITFAFAYLTDKFAKDLLLDKKVIIKKIKGKNVIFIGNESYNDLLLKSGYLFKNGNPVYEDAFKRRIEYIKKSDLKIYNAKSNKYHNLNCKYGLMAHNYVVLPKQQIPKGAKPCKYCLKKNLKKHKFHKKNIKCPSLVYSNGCIKVFYTDFTTKLKPDRQCNTQICNELVKEINSAKSTIDIAIYGYDRVPKIENAIRRAIARGVRVRLVYDIDSKESNIYANTKEFANLINNSKSDKAPNYVKNSIKYTNSIMHDKFYIFDNSKVITGSANLSYTDMSGFNSNSVILINSKKIADIFTKEFEQMYNGRCHYLKNEIPAKNNIILGKSELSICFSPTDSAIEKTIVPLIDNAKHYIYMPVFLITDKRLAAALINAKNRGVEIKVIVDATNAKAKYSKHRLLRQHGIKVKTENYAGKLHSKSMIIDDAYTVIGSMNFSGSGEKKNDENLIVVKNSGLAKHYKKFFEYLWVKIPDFWLTHDVSAESIYSIGSCSDGIDNDYDGLIDSADEGCRIKFKKKYSKH